MAQDVNTARTVIVRYLPKAGQDAALLELVRSHVPLLCSLGLAAEQAPYIMRAGDGSLVEVFSWASVAAIERAHELPEVLAMWKRFGELCRIEAIGRLPEASKMFAEFEAL